MNEPAITVCNLSKQYVLGGEADSQKNFREMLNGLAAAPFRRLRKLQGTSRKQEQFWALKDISFEVNQGEVLGIIGRNGAGKSTLLKILSRITAPTEGKITYRGRLASLLEVGTGFHPELSGRENIFVNGAILGMAKAEIQKKFDEIVDFAGVEQFLDTPVKRYSSGMYVRLAFAVAAHLDPDILVIDEVLAVGDAEFQKKCLGKLQEVAVHGRTVLFVSHNLASVVALCSSGLLLDQGKVAYSGDVDQTVQQYMATALFCTGGKKKPVFLHNGSGEVLISDVQLQMRDQPLVQPVSGKPFGIVVRLESKQTFSEVSIQVGIYDAMGRRIVLLDSNVENVRFVLTESRHIIFCHLDELPLYPGGYFVNVAVLKGLMVLDAVEHCLDFMVEKGDFFGTGYLPSYGPLLLRSSWDKKKENNLVD